MDDAVALCRNCGSGVSTGHPAIYDGMAWFCDLLCHSQWLEYQRKVTVKVRGRYN